METSKPAFEKYIFVCENQREQGQCCAPEGSVLREALKKAVKVRGFSDKIRVSRSGCLDVCAEGPNVLLMPDNIWFKRVDKNNIAQIMERAIRGLSR
ncbi:MAG: hypothetical protein AUJ72_02605 [Candidatus Omnitrophica bacterium CG1_02_46_14]|nr:MAG: hypothetical protein AUJ72_02605 [Candidatus Omnitrophica bacterium CG1_02_46_14]